MTGVAVLWRTGKYAALVATLALRIGVRAIQRESSRGVVEPICFCGALLYLRNFRHDFCRGFSVRNGSQQQRAQHQYRTRQHPYQHAPRTRNCATAGVSGLR
jgi:hypothetical protein